MTPELKSALDRLVDAWGKDQTKHYTEMFRAISQTVTAYTDYKLTQPIDGSEKMGRLKSGKYSRNV